MFCRSFLAYSTMAVLLYCSFGDSPNATRWIASYLELNETSGYCKDLRVLRGFTNKP